MKTAGLLLSFVFVFFCDTVLSQNIFDPLDSLVTYDSTAQPGTPQNPNQPALNRIGKWVRTVRLDWNSSNFKSYIYNGMQFRLRFPNNYNPLNADKYPVIVFFHGGGEVGTVYDNEVQLLWGAQPFQNRINSNEWNGFMIFPQEPIIGWNDYHFSRLNTVLDTLEKYNNIDPDRIISMGLSAGGYGSLSYASQYPQRIATVIAASPIQSISFIPSLPTWIQIPVWFANGGWDLNPDPVTTQEFYTSFRNTGGNIFQSYFARDGHNTWVDMWDIRDISFRLKTTTYWNNAHKAQPLLYFQHAQFCDTEPVSARMGITAGYSSYQWDKDGSIIPAAIGNEYTATQTGSYRVRFKRNSTSEWSMWTPNPVVITSKACTVDTVYTEHFTADNKYNASPSYTKGNFTAQNGIITSGTSLFTQDAAGVRGSRFMVNFTDTTKGYQYTKADLVWSNTNPITVLPNTDYEYSFWLGNQNDTAPARIVGAINGIAISQDTASAKGTGISSWTKFTYRWNSGNATTAVLSLINTQSAFAGNDFTIDEISLRRTSLLTVPTCGVIVSPINGSTVDSLNSADLQWRSTPTATSYDLYLWTGDSMPAVRTANVADTNYHASNLLPGTNYKWFIVPRNEAGAATGCSSNMVQFNTAAIPVPSCVQVIAPATGTIVDSTTMANLRWTASANASSYDVYIWSGTDQPAVPTINTNDTSYQATSLLPSTNYNWYIIPRNTSSVAIGCGTTTSSSFTTAAIVIPVPPCASNISPANETIIDSQTSISLSWTAVATAVSYDVYIWTGDVIPSLPLANTTNTGYDTTGLIAGTVYHWFIAPRNASGAATSCVASNTSSFTTAAVVIPVPACPIATAPINEQSISSSTSAQLQWSSTTGAVSYDVFIWTGAYKPSTPSSNLSDTAYTVTGLSAGTTYYWNIIPKNAKSESIACSSPTTNSFTTAVALPAIPDCAVNLSPANETTISTQHTADLSWHASPLATSYDIYLWIGTIIPTAALVTVTDTFFTATNLSPATDYQWYVLPKNASGAAVGCVLNSQWSFTTAAEEIAMPACTVNISPVNGTLFKTSTGINLQWTAVDSADSYDVYLWTGATMPLSPLANVQANSYELKGLSAATTYNWFVAARNTAGAALACAADGASSFTTAAIPDTSNPGNTNPINPPIADTLKSMLLYPNPANQGQQIHLKVYSRTGGRVRIIIRNTTGVALINTTAQVKAGINDCIVQNFALNAGFYIFFIDGDITTPGNRKVIVR